jgi:hypothetical protein
MGFFMRGFIVIVLVLLVMPLIAACSTVVNGQTQTIRVETPGAQEAECTLDNGNKYKAYNGTTLTIMRSHKDLVVHCFAAGNREKTITVESGTNDWAIGNVATGIVPGLAYDHYSGAMFEYPSVITVDFIGVPTRGFELPEYHNRDAPNPYMQGIENYGPAQAMKQGEEWNTAPVIERRTPENSNPFQGSSAQPPQAAASSVSTAMMAPVPAQPMPSQATPVMRGGTAEELTRSMNPSVFGQQ